MASAAASSSSASSSGGDQEKFISVLAEPSVPVDSLGYIDTEVCHPCCRPSFASCLPIDVNVLLCLVGCGVFVKLFLLGDLSTTTLQCEQEWMHWLFARCTSLHLATTWQSFHLHQQWTLVAVPHCRCVRMLRFGSVYPCPCRGWHVVRCSIAYCSFPPS